MIYCYKTLQEKEVFQESVESFKSKGFVVIKDIFQKDELEILRQSSNQLERDALSKDLNDPVLKHSFSDVPYHVLASSLKSEVLHRGNDQSYDQGMTDIFNPPYWYARNSPKCLELLARLRSGLILKLINAVNSNASPKNNNLYIHKSVENPRCPHIDSIRDYFKLFLALSDQTSLSCGPFGVIPKTHSKKIKNYLMCQVNKRFYGLKGGRVTDATFYNDQSLTPIFLELGSLAICNQSIVHGALPAATNEGRLTFVQTYDR